MLQVCVCACVCVCVCVCVFQAIRCLWLHDSRKGKKYKAVPSSGISSRNSAGLVSMATTTSVSVGMETSHIKPRHSNISLWHLLFHWCFYIYSVFNSNMHAMVRERMSTATLKSVSQARLLPYSSHKSLNASSSTSDNTNTKTRETLEYYSSNTGVLCCSAEQLCVWFGYYMNMLMI